MKQKCPQGFLVFKSCSEDEYSLAPKRCNDRIECWICAKEFSDRKRFKTKSLIKSLIEAQGRKDVLTGELTIPKALSSILEATKDKRKDFCKAGRRAIQQFTRRAGVLMVYQNWGETPPIKPHWHIHFLIFPFMPDGSKVVNFIPREKLLAAWKFELVEADVLSPKEAKEIKVVNLEAIEASDKKYFPKLYHRLNYMVRQPIEDLKRIKDEREKKKVLEIAGRMGKRFTRFFWFGWLASACRKKGLEQLEIELVKFKKDDGIDWEFLGFGDIIEDDGEAFFY